MFTNIVASATGEYVYASTFNTHGNGFIYRSDDYGEHWTEIPRADDSLEFSLEVGYPVPTVPVADWNMITVSDDGQYVIALKYMSNLMYRSEDYGKTWLRSASAPDVFSSICMDGSGLKIIGTAQFLYVSLDGGNSWGRDDESGMNGWLQCRISTDGTKAAIRRFIPHQYSGENVDDEHDEVPTSATAVYVNEPWPPTFPPTPNPTNYPVPNPTRVPTLEPTVNPTPFPTDEPTRSPIYAPTHEPTQRPNAPSMEPTIAPTAYPSQHPTVLQPYAISTLRSIVLIFNSLLILNAVVSDMVSHCCTYS